MLLSNEEEAVLEEPEPNGMMNVARALTRPLLALGSMGMFIAALFTGRIDEIPDWLAALGSLTIVWWFGERTFQKVLEKVQR